MTGLEAYGHAALGFISANRDWAVPIVFLFSFGESLAFIGLLLPATVVMIGVGALVGAGTLDFLPIWLAAAVGAGLGDWVSYWFGDRYQTAVWRMWPLRNYPELEGRGVRFFNRWGVLGVFAGRFFGPLRSSVPLVAGVMRMRKDHFQIANWSSAFVWAAAIMAPGALGVGLFAG